MCPRLDQRSTLSAPIYQILYFHNNSIHIVHNLKTALKSCYRAKRRHFHLSCPILRYIALAQRYSVVHKLTFTVDTSFTERSSLISVLPFAVRFALLYALVQGMKTFARVR